MNMEFKFRTGDICLITSVAGVLALLVIFEVLVRDGGNFRHGASMKTVAAGIEQTDGTLVFRGPDDNVVALKIGGEVGRTLYV